MESKITAVHANKLDVGKIGIKRTYCNVKDLQDSVRSHKQKYIDFITCRKCEAPLRMQIQAKKNEYTGEVKDQWWHTIEPMVWVNPCWWFCIDCYPHYPDKTPLLPTKDRWGFLENAVDLMLITKSKPYEKDL